MTGLDYIVALLVVVAAIGGYLRGLVEEMLSLAAWFVGIFAIRFFHSDVTGFLQPYVGNSVAASVLAFGLLLMLPYGIMKLVAGRAGAASRKSALGPIDRVLGLGFGVVKGVLISVIAFSLLVLGYDTIWGYGGRPTWITTARSYSLVDAGSRSLVEIIAERRERMRVEAEEAEEKGGGKNGRRGDPDAR